MLLGWAGINIDEFPSLKNWLYKLKERPGFEKGRNVPTRHTAFDKLTKEEIEKREQESRAWVQSGMQADAKK